METKKYYAEDMPAAMEQIKRELGSDAIIIKSRKIKQKYGPLGLFRKSVYEVVVSCEEEPPKRKEPARESAREAFAHRTRQAAPKAPQERAPMARKEDIPPALTERFEQMAGRVTASQGEDDEDMLRILSVAQAADRPAAVTPAAKLGAYAAQAGQDAAPKAEPLRPAPPAAPAVQAAPTAPFVRTVPQEAPAAPAIQTTPPAFVIRPAPPETPAATMAQTAPAAPVVRPAPQAVPAAPMAQTAPAAPAARPAPQAAPAAPVARPAPQAVPVMPISQAVPSALVVRPMQAAPAAPAAPVVRHAPPAAPAASVVRPTPQAVPAEPAAPAPAASVARPAPQAAPAAPAAQAAPLTSVAHFAPQEAPAEQAAPLTSVVRPAVSPFARAQEEPAQPVKRGRGRPRKNPPFAVAAAVQAAPAAPQQGGEETMERLASLERMVLEIRQHMIGEAVPEPPVQARPVLSKAEPEKPGRESGLSGLLARLAEQDVDQAALETLEAASRARMASGLGDYDALAGALEQLLGRPRYIRTSKFKPRCVMFIGPTGVGKTTTLVKLASSCMFERGARVGIINADVFRVGAQDQLGAYARILNAPLTTIYDSSELAQAVEAFAHLDFVFIDTSGRAPQDEAYQAELSRLTAQGDIHEIYLTISSATSGRVCRQIVKEYQGIGAYRTVITKLDESGSYGALVNVCHASGQPLSYVTTGQNVPEDIQRARVDEIIASLLR